MRTNQFRLLWVALLSLSGVLPAAATDYEAADYLPLAVGNSWTYEHEWYDIDRRYGDRSRWTTYIAQVHDPRQFTITVERTEIIDGKTYYVLSNMPANWPPAPPHFIAGKKLRWEGTHLMERTAYGERSVFRFDGTNDTGYTISVYDGDNLVKTTEHSHPNGNWKGYWFNFYGPNPGLRSCTFIKSYGCLGCGWGIAGSDYGAFTNKVRLLRAVLGDRTVESEDALMSTASQSSSWGQVKQSLMVQSPEGRANQ